jgi:putative ABC transport system substrate-binding protein
MKKTWSALLIAAAVMVAAPAGPRVIALLSSDSPPYREHLAGFKDHFPRGVEVWTLSGDTSALRRRLERQGPGLLLAVGGEAAVFIARGAFRFPAVYTMVYDPARHGLAAGPRACGAYLKVAPSKTLEALESVWPGGGRKIRFGALHLAGAPEDELDAVRAALLAHGHTLRVVEVSGPSQIGKGLKELDGAIDAYWLLAEPGLVPDQQYLELIFGTMMDRKVAVVGLSDAHVKLGALLSVSVDYRLEGAHAARLAEEALAGKPMQQIGLQGPENLIWSVNLDVAREIGWEIAPLTRKRFERVYP